MNFNYSQKPEYNLYRSVSREIIDLYGIKCKLIEVKKINVSTIVNEWSHIKTDGKAIHDVCVMPEMTDSFDSSDYQFTNMGFLPADNMTCYISSEVLDKILGLNKAIGNLIILPSNKVMEITDVNIQVPQANNLYAFNDEKTVYKLRLIPYAFKLHDQITDTHLINTVKIEDPNEEVIGELKTSLYKFNQKKVIRSKSEEELEKITKENYKALDNYLNVLEQQTIQQDANVTNPDSPIYDTNETDIWHKH